MFGSVKSYSEAGNLVTAITRKKAILPGTENNSVHLAFKV